MATLLFFFQSIWIVAKGAAAATLHLHRDGATRLGTEVVAAVLTGVNCNSATAFLYRNPSAATTAVTALHPHRHCGYCLSAEVVVAEVMEMKCGSDIVFFFYRFDNNRRHGGCCTSPLQHRLYPPRHQGDSTVLAGVNYDSATVFIYIETLSRQ